MLLDVPLDSRAEREFAAALVARPPTRFATVPDGDEFAREAWAASARRWRRVPDPPRRQRSGAPAPLRVHGERPPVRERAGDVRLFSAPGEGREAVEIVPARPRRGGAAASVRRDGRVPPHAAAVSRAARARVRARRRAGVFRSRHAPPRSRRPRVRRAALLRRRKGCRRSGSTNTCRLARCRSVAGEAAAQPTLRDGTEAPVGADDGCWIAGRSRRGVRRVPDGRRRRGRAAMPRLASARFRRRGGRGRHAAIAVEVGGADRRVGGGRRAQPRRTARRAGAAGSTGWRPTTGTGSRSSSGTSRSRRASRASRATCAISRTCASSRCRSSTSWPSGPSARPGASGSIGFPRSRPRDLDGPSACCRCSPSCGRWPTWVRSRSRRRATCCTIAS